MNRGYVKVWRKIEDSGLIQLPNTLALFMHLVLSATHKDRKLGTPSGVIELKRGQYVSGRVELSLRLKQSEQQIRTSLKRLEELGIITIKATNKFSIYTIENYSKYQDDNRESNQQVNQLVTNNQPSNNQQSTTKQELKHLSIEENINTSVSNGVANCPHEEIIKLYALHLPMLTQVKVWSDRRGRLLKARWREDTKRQNIQWWDRFFKFIATSDFLTGKATEWQADIEWILTSNNFIKILEGKYENKVAA